MVGDIMDFEFFPSVFITTCPYEIMNRVTQTIPPPIIDGPMLRTYSALSLLCVIVFSHSLRAEDKLDPVQVEFFETKIRPVLVQHCYSCHSLESDSVKGGYLLDSRKGIRQGGDSGAGIVPGKPDESLLLSAMKYESFEMPPKGKLPESVLKDFELWIKNGAVDPREGGQVVTRSSIDYAKAADFWSFKKPAVTDLPQVRQSDWVKNEVDNYILASLEENHMEPGPRADKRTLIRRAYYDLIGLPPTPLQIESFLNDDSAEAFSEVVESLLASKHYGERWGRYWLDVARYGEDQAHTFKARKYPRGYLYRDWVVQSFNDDMPYNTFVKYQVAGDLIDAPNQHERLAALGLFALGPVYYAENVEKAKAAADEWDDRIDTVSRGVLGLTVSCARCHDHKYDPISTSDYYGLAGLFASTNYQERPVVSPSVVQQRASADQAVKDKELEINRFLVTAGKQLRPSLTQEIPNYVTTAFQWLERNKVENDQKKIYQEVLKDSGLSETLLKRWVALLQMKNKSQQQTRPYLAEWFEWRDSLPADKDQSQDELILAKAKEVGVALQQQVEAKLASREKLFELFGENVAFVKSEDVAKVKPGVLPLGNLFDDGKTVPLDGALSSDAFGATAEPSDLGVLKTAFGWGERIHIGPEIDFDFVHLGADDRAYGKVSNDSWLGKDGISTTGQGYQAAGKRQEQGIGMHANALATFDLDEIRKAGLMPQDQKFRFKVDRAGLNDDVKNSGASAHFAVIISKPHKDRKVMDAILGGYVNGKKMQITYSDFTYYFTGVIPPPMKADGQFFELEVEVASAAKYVTLVTTGAGGPDENSISSDHAVWSGVRLELDPLPQEAVAEAELNEQDLNDEALRQDAILLSSMLYEEGLLALPPNEAEARLEGDTKAQIVELRNSHEQLKKEAEAIEILRAHSLTEGKAQDLPVYLAGDPGKKGDIAERANLAIFTQGEKVPYESAGSGRLEFANSIASEDNPLTARVMVNRIWSGHFGKGLVGTLSNFGTLGDRPSHPALLDFLALEFMQNSWSMKHIHRLVMNSATYQQSSQFNAQKFEADPDNKLIWRMNRRRLEVEPWRDGLLAVSGELQLDMGGPSTNLDDANNKRRTLYGFVSRHRLNELLRLFDFPDPNITAAARPVTTVPLQQLFVLNSDFMMNRARALSSRVESEMVGTLEEKIQKVFELLYGRSADDADVALGKEFLETVGSESDMKSAWDQYALALLSANEFMFVD